MLSPKVKEALEEAQGNLRTALSFAARNEKPHINKQIAELLHASELIIRTEELSDKLESLTKRMSSEDVDFFGLS